LVVAAALRCLPATRAHRRLGDRDLRDLRSQPAFPDVGRRTGVVRTRAYFGLGSYGVAFLAKLAGLPMITCLLLGPLLGSPARPYSGFFAVQLSASISRC